MCAHTHTDMCVCVWKTEGGFQEGALEEGKGDRKGEAAGVADIACREEK